MLYDSKNKRKVKAPYARGRTRYWNLEPHPLPAPITPLLFRLTRFLCLVRRLAGTTRPTRPSGLTATAGG